MEKTQKGNTITIKIDGKPRHYKENKDIQESTNFISEQKKTFEVEQLQREATLEVAAAEQKEDDLFDWVLPETPEGEELKEYKIVDTTKKPNKSAKPKYFVSPPQNQKSKILSTVFFATFFAVLIGTSFGFILLKMVTQDGTLGGNGTPASGIVSPNEETIVPVNVAIPLLTTFVIQEGAYKTIEGAKEAKLAIEKKGNIPSSIVTKDQEYILIGISSSKEEAKIIGEQLKLQGVNVYAKELPIGGRSVPNLLPAEKELLELTSNVYAPLVVASTNLALGKSNSEENISVIQKLTDRLKTIDDNTLKNPSTIAMKEELDEAISLALSNKPINNLAFQQHLLNILSHYEGIK